MTRAWTLLFAAAGLLAPAAAVADVIVPAPADAPGPAIVFARDYVGPLRADTVVTAESLARLFPAYAVRPARYEDEGGFLEGFELLRGSRRVLFVQVRGNRIETVAGYEPEVSSQHGVHIGDSRRSVRKRLVHVKCEADNLSGDDDCFELTVPQIQYMFDEKNRVHMMEWNPRPTVTAE